MKKIVLMVALASAASFVQEAQAETIAQSTQKAEAIRMHEAERFGATLAGFALQLDHAETSVLVSRKPGEDYGCSIYLSDGKGAAAAYDPNPSRACYRAVGFLRRGDGVVAKP